MLKYTIGFLKRKDEILLLNREKPSWMGCWNGVGGKIAENETPDQCILREIGEETGIILSDMEFKGIVTWRVDGEEEGGMYAFLAELPADFPYPTPVKTDEGILDWKKLNWILHPDNAGIANLQYFLPTMLKGEGPYKYHFVYEKGRVAGFQTKPLEKGRDADVRFLPADTRKAGGRDG